MSIKNLDQLLQVDRINEQKTLVVANGVDIHTLEAVSKAVDLGLAHVILTGNIHQIESTCNENGIDWHKFQLVHCTDADLAAKLAVDLVKSGQANAFMKGLIGTDVFMKAILNKENGILNVNGFLSHISVFEHPKYHKLLLASDVAIVPLPSLEQKKLMVENMVEVANLLGIKKPNIAFIAATEKVIGKMLACTEAKQLIDAWHNGELTGCECLGPVALDVAIDKEAANIKGIVSPVAGEADCLLFPNIESGNVFYKTSTKLCGAKTAAIVCGANVPVVLSSRGDSIDTKLYSIALSLLIG